MATFLGTNAFVSINGVNLSDHVVSVEITQEAEDVDMTTMGATARQHLPGLRSDGFTVTFLQDYAAGSVDQTLSPLVGSTTPFAFELRPTSAAVSTTNPKYTGSALLLTYSPFSADVGDRVENEVEFVSQGAIVRGTS
jgi:hypothetical protein